MTLEELMALTFTLAYLFVVIGVGLSLIKKSDKERD